jgi:hypothetical protein
MLTTDEHGFLQKKTKAAKGENLFNHKAQHDKS